MKKLILSFAVIMFAVSFVSCEKDEPLGNNENIENGNGNENPINENEFSIVGTWDVTEAGYKNGEYWVFTDERREYQVQHRADDGTLFFETKVWHGSVQLFNANGIAVNLKTSYEITYSNFFESGGGYIEMTCGMGGDLTIIVNDNKNILISGWNGSWTCVKR